MPTPDVQQRELTGEVQSVRRLKENFFGIRLRPAGAESRTFIDLVGEVDPQELPSMQGMSFRFFGQWADHPSFGWQFKFDGFFVTDQQSNAGIVNYLSRSNLGINRGQAAKLVARYGLSTLTIIKESPAALVKDGYFDEVKANELSVALRSLARFERPRIELFQMFSGYGFPRNTVDGCIRVWKEKAPEVVRRDPYKMLVARLDGVGFARADKLYQAHITNPKQLSRLKRQMLAAWHALATDNEGNTWMGQGAANGAILDAVGMSDFRGEQAIAMGIRSRWLRTRNGHIACAERASAEETIAAHLIRLMRGKPIWPADMAQGSLSDHQFEKVKPLLPSPVAILAGTPGTGKTFTAAALLREVITMAPGIKIAVCAPTGKAAVRITMAMQKYDLPLTATTIHRLLMGGPDGGFTHDASNPVPFDLVVVDEVSMCDTDIMAALFSALPDGCNVLLVGDPYQLPPVGHGAPLRDFLAAQVPNALLTEIKRNAGLIVEACRAIKDGQPIVFSNSGLSEEPQNNLAFVQIEKPEDQVDMVLKAIETVAGKGLDPIWDVQVLVARNDETPLSRKVLNPVLQNLLNPAKAGTKVDKTNDKYRVGDKFMCLRNQSLKVAVVMKGNGIEADNVDHYDLFSGAEPAYVANGDMGRVVATAPDKIIVQFFYPDRTVVIDDKPASNKEFDLAYAITCHKSQGSEYRFVIIPLDRGGFGVGCREWIYTGVSRPFGMGLLIGDRAVLARYCREVKLGKRKTFLKELVMDAMVKERERIASIAVEDAVDELLHTAEFRD